MFLSHFPFPMSENVFSVRKCNTGNFNQNPHAFPNWPVSPAMYVPLDIIHTMLKNMPSDLEEDEENIVRKHLTLTSNSCSHRIGYDEHTSCFWDKVWNPSLVYVSNQR